MTSYDAQQHAARVAAARNWPWNPVAVGVRSWRLWPLPRVWQVSSRVASEGAITTLRINARTGVAVFGRVVYPAGGLPAE